MRSGSQYTIGIHNLMLVEFFRQDSITSQIAARSIGCNPVIVRNVFTKLKKAGLLKPGYGRRRTELGRPADTITLYDVFMATESDDLDTMFKMYPANLNCPVGSDIHGILSSRFGKARDAMLKVLSETTIADLVADLPPEKNVLPEELRQRSEGSLSETS